MIHFPCPKCDRPVDAAPEAAGRRVQCPGCGALVPVPGEATTPAGAPPALDRKQWYRQFLGSFAFLIPLLLVALGVGGYAAYQHWFAANVWVYVDNTGEQPLTVRLDGDVKTTVAPGTFGIVKCRDGSHRLKVTRGDDTVFDEAKEFSKPADRSKPSKYLLNPDATGRYHTHTIQYGAAFFPGGLGAVKQRLKEFLPALGDEARPFAGLNDQQVNTLRNNLSWVAHELVLVPPAVWQDLSKYDIVLEQAPKKIKAEITGEQKVFNRLSPADYDLLKLTDSGQKMTRQELANAVRALEHVVKADWPE